MAEPSIFTIFQIETSTKNELKITDVCSIKQSIHVKRYEPRNGIIYRNTVLAQSDGLIRPRPGTLSLHPDLIHGGAA